jgi:hypothetical protein
MPTKPTVRVSHPDAVTTHVRVPIENSRTEQGLRAALELLLATTKKLPGILGENEDEEVPPFLVVTFHSSNPRRWLSERRFFERCARFSALRPLVARYVEQVSPKRWKHDPFAGTGFWTSMMTPAGALAAVPLALADASHVETAITHLRGSALGNETFHRSFITEAVERHGVDATLRLIAFRAVDGQGQNGEADLQWLMTRALRQHLDREGGLEAFAALVDEISERKNYRALYVSNAGKGLFSRDPERFARWLRAFDLPFDEHERTLGEAREPYAPRPWKEAWNEAASCTDRDD